MTERAVPVEPHAYVDECLGRAERLAFEAKLRDDPDLRRRVDLWLAQNEAIRAAFQAPSRPRGPLSIGRATNENHLAPHSSASEPRRAPPREPPTRTRAAPPDVKRGLPQPGGEPARGLAWPIRATWALILAAMMVAVSGSNGASDQRGMLAEAGRAAFRAFGADLDVTLDIATADPRVLASRLSPRLGTISPPSRFEVPGWTLIGARFVPGARSLAALVLWESRDRARMGLLIEPLDAPADSPPRVRSFGGLSVSAWTAGGVGFATVSREASGRIAAERTAFP